MTNKGTDRIYALKDKDERYAELMVLLNDLGELPVSIAPQWIFGIIGRLRANGYALRFWRGLYEHKIGEWVEISRSSEEPKKRKTYSDTPSRLGEVRRAWLIERFGGCQPGIRQLIDAEMAKESKPAYAQLLTQFESETYAKGGINFGTAQHFTMLLFADWLDKRAAQALRESPGLQAQAGEVEEWK